MDLKQCRAFFFDMDGVLSVGKENPRYLGGRELVTRLQSLGKKTFVLTNDSTHSREDIYENLSRLGFGFGVEQILTSSYLTATYLTEHFSPTTFFLVGEQGLRNELEKAGHQFSDNSPKVVVVGLDRQLSYDKLDRAVRFVRNGALLIGSYGGALYMSDHGPALSAGPLIGAVEKGSGKKALMIGKPSPRMFRLALKQANERPIAGVMVGDQIETDLVGAYRAGVHTVLVLTGVETRDTIKHSRIKPDLVLDNVDDLNRFL
jgi:HAD superfamily hydrolase (TIGR01450 family)